MKRFFIALALSLAATMPLSAQAPIGWARARQIALSAVTNNEGIKSEKLKRRDGILAYEFDVETPGPGHTEIRVDARTGHIIANKHEDDIVGKAAQETEHAAKKAAHATKKAAKKVAHEADKAVGGEDLSAKASISESRARTVALGRHPGGMIRESKLDKEDGVVVWKIKIKTAGKPDDHVVLVNATTGAIVEHKH